MTASTAARTKHVSLADLTGGIPVKVTTNVAFPLCKGLHVGVAGSATVTFEDGSVGTDFPLVLGVNLYPATKVVFGTASDVWAIY